MEERPKRGSLGEEVDLPPPRSWRGKRACPQGRSNLRNQEPEEDKGQEASNSG